MTWAAVAGWDGWSTLKANSGSSLTNQFGGVAAFEVGISSSLMLLFQETRKKLDIRAKGCKRCLTTTLLNDLPSFLLVELVTHVLARLVELCLTLALLVSTIKF